MYILQLSIEITNFTSLLELKLAIAKHYLALSLALEKYLPSKRSVLVIDIAM